MQIYDSGDDLEARVEQEAMMLIDGGVKCCALCWFLVYCSFIKRKTLALN
jgi:hypothetical protein